uniref:Uncharacterized protein n=1 Tax=Trichogramma kaykai TaxID=54128 RepID=A0ABD2WJG4_9HYME
MLAWKMTKIFEPPIDRRLRYFKKVFAKLKRTLNDKKMCNEVAKAIFVKPRIAGSKAHTRASLPLTRTFHKHESPTSVNYHRTGTKTTQDTAENEARSLGVVEDGCSIADGGGDDNDDDDDDVGAERNRASINMRIS